MSLKFFPRRMIHLDFHTGPDIPDVGADFDPRQFAQAFKEAHVDSVTVFAKCHHGHLYYTTNHPSRHPSLPASLNLLGEQIEALHSAGIRAPIYLSVQCDEYAANQHPEWIALTPELRHVKRGDSPFVPGWQILDMSSPYQDYLADQLAEVLKLFGPTDGIFLDMCWDQVSCSKWAIDAMLGRGLDPMFDTDRRKYARSVALEYMERYRRMVDDAHPASAPVGVWFNSRPKTNLREEKKFLRHIEVESLPTGGWGYSYFPYVSRFVRPLGFPTLSHTGRFHRSWGDNGGLKPAAALKYECSQILSQGITSGVGDLLHPRGVPHPEVYRLIGDVYDHIRRCEPFVEGTQPVKEVAMVVDPELGDQPGPSGLGAVRALQQLRLQFDVLPPEASLEGYKVALIPETTRIDEALAASLRRFLDAGGSVMVSGAAALGADGKAAMPELGIEVEGPSPYDHVFLRPDESINQGLPKFDSVMPERGWRIKPAAGAQSLCTVVEPYFQRSYHRFSGHEYTVPDRASEWSAVVQNGRCITFAVPVFQAYGEQAMVAHRQLIDRCMQRLLPRPMVRDQGPVHAEMTAVQRDRCTVVHVISYLPARQAKGLDLVYDPFPLVDTPVEIRVDHAPRSVHLQPHGTPLKFAYADGYVRLNLTLLDGHGMIVIEHE